ncbi:fluoride efflux transporter CrcB [Evansella sp. AB-P1]|uniref:fluoride efflux transporter CrcB n=1 Tax=Evansella sp. AB-P1 TaxID=3037653 RepID=UPI00241EED9C|nr:fluoride efflux transporter CrcB [Evansella sp. AB-P1]MDG5787986.1 fluoride efflux transporter CrcB [Evansella sp. AB-P1]
MIGNMLIVAIGGGIGAVGRYLLGVWIKSHTKERFIPTAMLYVNLLGSFGLGLLFNLLYGEIPSAENNEKLYIIFGIGFFGAFTTFSTFSVEAATLLKKKKLVPFITYILFSIGGSILFFLVGFIAL